MLDGEGRIENVPMVLTHPEQFADSLGVAVCGPCRDIGGPQGVTARANAFASTTVRGLGLDSVVVVRLEIGASVRGRVLRNGRPVAGVRVTDQSGPELVTGADGTYVVSNLIPRSSQVFYTPMDHGQSAGATRSCYVEIGKTGSTAVAPDLVVGPVHTLRGVLIAPRGMRFGAPTLLFWSRTILSQRNKDSYYERPYLYLPPDGSFEIVGLPEQTIQLEFSYPGWTFAPHPPPPFRRGPDGTTLIWDAKADLNGVRIPLAYETPKPAPIHDSEP